MALQIEGMSEQACLYCKRRGRWTSVEHVFPQGLGRHADETLPVGAVCGECNNTLGRQVDEALVHLFEVRLIRGLFQIPDAQGNTVNSIPLSNGTLTFGPDGSIDITVTSKKWLEERQERELAAKLRYHRRRSGDQWRRVARAVMKMGLGLIYLSDGPDSALAPDLDCVRGAVRGESYEGFLLIGPFDVYRKPDVTGKIRNDFAGMKLSARLEFGGLDLIAPFAFGRPSAATTAWADANGFQVMTISRAARS